MNKFKVGEKIIFNPNKNWMDVALCDMTNIIKEHSPYYGKVIKKIGAIERGLHTYLNCYLVKCPYFVENDIDMKEWWIPEKFLMKIGVKK